MCQHSTIKVGRLIQWFPGPFRYLDTIIWRSWNIGGATQTTSWRLMHHDVLNECSVERRARISLHSAQGGRSTSSARLRPCLIPRAFQPLANSVSALTWLTGCQAGRGGSASGAQMASLICFNLPKVRCRTVLYITSVHTCVPVKMRWSGRGQGGARLSG
jgi:hypothetical protein